MQTQNRKPDYWKLDYNWSKRGGKWTDFTDVMLIGKTKGDECCANALKEWVSLQEKDRAQIDGSECEIFYAGGIQGYLGFSSDESLKSLEIYLHSHGQDAFDSLSYYSKEISKFLRLRGCDCSLTWVEARHDRKDHQLKWP